MGVTGSNQRYGDKEWLGFWGEDLEITIDLGKLTTIKTFSSRFITLQDNGFMLQKNEPLQLYRWEKICSFKER